MNVRLPPKFQTGKAAEHKRAMRLFFICAGFILHDRFGFGDKRLREFYIELDKFIDTEQGNKTLADEAEAWAKKHNILQW